MKKNKLIILAVICIAAGILAGIGISEIVWRERFVLDFSGVFSENPVIKNTEDPAEDQTGNKKGLKKEYSLTKDQKYYKSLVDEDDRNVLMIGEDAYSGSWDAIIIASISEKNKKIQVLNFPRDIYIDYSEEVLSQLREKSPKLYEAKGFQKINAAHTVGARIGYKAGKGTFSNSNIDFLADLIEEIFEIRVDDYAYVNTKGFRDIVDLFDGVTVEVPVRMKYDDPVQDLHIDLQKGKQHLNGVQAEGFVRFRQGYDDNGEFRNYSDQFRKENQNKFLEAFFKQHITLKNLGKIDDIGKLMNENIRTSIQSMKTITSYANMLRKALSANYTRESLVIECPEPKKIDGVYFDIIRSK